MRAHTSGAVKPPSEWPTTITSCRSPTALTTASAYSHQPADSSWHRKIDRERLVAALPQLGHDSDASPTALPPPPWISAKRRHDRQG